MAVSVWLDSSNLDSRIRTLLGNERQVQVDFLLCLAEFDDAKGYEALDYATLWQYCERGLGLLECAIARRIQAMKILRRFPAAEAYLRDGRLCMTGIGMLERALTPENCITILDRASRKSTREISAIAVESNAPVPEKATLRRVPSPVAARKEPTPVAMPPPLPDAGTAGNAAGAGAQGVVGAREEAGIDPTARPGAGDVTRDAGSANADGADPRDDERRSDPTDRATRTTKQTVRQVSARQFKLTLVVGEEFKAKIDRVKKIFSHRIPSGNLEAILGAALDLVIAKDDKRHGPRPAQKTPRATRTSTARASRGDAVAGSVNGNASTGAPATDEVAGGPKDGCCGPRETRRTIVVEADIAREAAERIGCERAEFPWGKGEREYIPVELEAALWARDSGKCTWLLANGEHCGSEHQVQIDHIVPVAKGGKSVLSNLRLYCARHNMLAARREFGEEHMAKFASKK